MNVVQTTLRMIAAGLWIFCLGFLVLSLPFYRSLYRILKTWPSVPAQVVESRVVPVASGANDLLYDAEYKLAFRVDGTPIVATAYSNHQSTSRERKSRQVERFPSGFHTTILYNPADPHDIRLQPGYNVHFFAVPAFISGLGLILGIFGGLLWAVSRLAQSWVRIRKKLREPKVA